MLDEMDYLKDSSEEEESPDGNMRLLHVASLKMNSIKDRQNSCKSSEWWEVPQIGNGTLHWQLDTDAYASVINTMQLKQVAPNAKIKPSKKTLVSYSQHRITAMGYVTLPQRFKDRRLHLNFYFINSKQKPILSGKVCQALNLVQRVRNSRADADQKELLDQHPDLQNASGAMPGTYSIKIDPTATPVVHGPARHPAALLPKILTKLEKEGHLAKVTQPTDWVNSMVV